MQSLRLSLLFLSALLVAAAPSVRAEFHSLEMPDLVGWYGGISGESHYDNFDFGQSFPQVGKAWLHAVGIANATTKAPADVFFAGKVDDVWGPALILYDVTDFDVEIQLSPPDSALDGEGLVGLSIEVMDCCDHSVGVFGATLWFCDGDPETVLGFESKDLLSWETTAEAVGYDLVRGDLGALRGSGGDYVQATEECLSDDSPADSLLYEAIPELGEGFWFLVRRVTEDGNANYDHCSLTLVGSRDEEIATSGTCE